MRKTRLCDLPTLARFVEKLIDWMYPEIDRAGGGVGEYFVNDATAGCSSNSWQEREFSGTVVVRLYRPEGTETKASLQRGCYANTNHGMFAVMIGPNGFISEIEMHFYTRQAPPFLEEILAMENFDVRDQGRREVLEDASTVGFFDVDEFFQSLSDRPIKTIEMDE